MNKGQKELGDLKVIFAALAHASRRQILLALKFRGGAMSAGEIADRFSCKWPTTTRHLKTLVKAELITVRKDGRGRLYELNQERLTKVLDGWLEWFRKDDEDQRS
jgi:DNA-binding transcriptional ArsR family regulator